MIYDCFTFFNEVDLLEIRLNVLDEIVDRFVIVEANKTFTGENKPFNFEVSKEKLKAFEDKIIYVQVTEYPTKIDSAWDIEYYQRNMIMEGLTDCNDEDVILISDIDEIPNPSAIEHYIKNLSANDGIYAFQQQLFYYYLNYRNAIYPHWNHGNITTFGKMRRDNLSPQEVRNSSNCKKIGGGVGIFPILVVTRLSCKRSKVFPIKNITMRNTSTTC